MSNVRVNRKGKRQSQDTSASKRPEKVTLAAVDRQICKFCKNKHPIFKCFKFLNLPVTRRVQEVDNMKLCQDCFHSDHAVENCKSQYRCRRCAQTHNTLLHIEPNQNTTRETPSNSEASPSTTVSTKCTVSNQILLSTVQIWIYDKDGNKHDCRALLDTGSQSSFIIEKLCRKLGTNQRSVNMPICGINSNVLKINKQTKVRISSKYMNFTATLNCLVIPKITENLPQTALDPVTLNIPEHIKLADTTFYQPSEVEMQLGESWFGV